MDQRIECCANCGRELFEQFGNSRKIFRSFATKFIDSVEVHYCYDCYVNLNKKVFEEKEKEE